jgi:hypothetical protein
MWDKWIRDSLNIGKEPKDYVIFLKKMQADFGTIDWKGNRTLAKVIDEYNYVTYTKPGLEKQKRKKGK